MLKTRFSKRRLDEWIQNWEKRLRDRKTDASSRITNISADWIDEKKIERDFDGKKKERIQEQGYKWITGERELN